MCMSNCRCCHCRLIGWRECNTRLYCWCQMHWSQDMDNHNIQLQYNIRRRHNPADMTNNCTYLTTRVPRAYNHFYTKCNPDILTAYNKHIVLMHTQCVDAHPISEVLPASVSIPVQNGHPAGITGIALAQNGNNIIAENKPPFIMAVFIFVKIPDFCIFCPPLFAESKRWFRLGMCILYNHTRVYYILDAI